MLAGRWRRSRQRHGRQFVVLQAQGGGAGVAHIVGRGRKQGGRHRFIAFAQEIIERRDDEGGAGVPGGNEHRAWERGVVDAIGRAAGQFVAHEKVGRQAAGAADRECARADSRFPRRIGRGRDEDFGRIVIQNGDHVRVARAIVSRAPQDGDDHCFVRFHLGIVDHGEGHRGDRFAGGNGDHPRQRREVHARCRGAADRVVNDQFVFQAAGAGEGEGAAVGAALDGEIVRRPGRHEGRHVDRRLGRRVVIEDRQRGLSGAEHISRILDQTEGDLFGALALGVVDGRGQDIERRRAGRDDPLQRRTGQRRREGVVAAADGRAGSVQFHGQRRVGGSSAGDAEATGDFPVFIGGGCGRLDGDDGIGDRDPIEPARVGRRDNRVGPARVGEAVAIPHRVERERSRGQVGQDVMSVAV